VSEDLLLKLTCYVTKWIFAKFSLAFFSVTYNGILHLCRIVISEKTRFYTQLVRKCFMYMYIKYIVHIASKFSLVYK